jgi:hypothetical protein
MSHIDRLIADADPAHDLIVPNGSVDEVYSASGARRALPRRRVPVGLRANLTYITIACCVVATLVIVSLGSASRPGREPRGAASTSSTTVATSTSTTPSNHPIPLPRPVPCGTGFFSAADQSFLTKWYGGEEMCFLSVDASTWLDVITDEVTAAPAGAVVLVDRCASDNSTCLNPNTIHSLSSFTVYPAPDPTRNLKVFNFLQDSPTLVIIQDGSCGIDVFDLATGRWYSDERASAQALLAGDLSAAVSIRAAPSFPATEVSPPSPSQPPRWCQT